MIGDHCVAFRMSEHVPNIPQLSSSDFSVIPCHTFLSGCSLTDCMQMPMQYLFSIRCAFLRLILQMVDENDCEA